MLRHTAHESVAAVNRSTPSSKRIVQYVVSIKISYSCGLLVSIILCMVRQGPTVRKLPALIQVLTRMLFTRMLGHYGVDCRNYFHVMAEKERLRTRVELGEYSVTNVSYAMHLTI